MIYRERELRSDDSDHPDQALLRQRAYRVKPTAGANAQAGEDGRPSDPRADIEAFLASSNSMAELQASLKCGTNCGSCLPELRRRIASRSSTPAAARSSAALAA